MTADTSSTSEEEAVAGTTFAYVEAVVGCLSKRTTHIS